MKNVGNVQIFGGLLPGIKCKLNVIFWDLLFCFGCNGIISISYNMVYKPRNPVYIFGQFCGIFMDQIIPRRGSRAKILFLISGQNMGVESPNFCQLFFFIVLEVGKYFEKY